MKSKLKKVVKHLKGDAKSWGKLAKESKSEQNSDKRLIKSLKKGKKGAKHV